MKKSVLFVNDTKFLKESSKYYNQSLSIAAWERYLQHFDSVEVLARQLKNKNKGSLALSSREEVSFSLSQHYSHPVDEILHWKKIRQHLLTRIKKADGVIIRLPSILGFHATSMCKKLKKPYALEVVGCPRDTYWNYGGLSGKILSPVNYLRMKRENPEF